MLISYKFQDMLPTLHLIWESGNSLVRNYSTSLILTCPSITQKKTTWFYFTSMSGCVWNVLPAIRQWSEKACTSMCSTDYSSMAPVETGERNEK